MVVINRQLTVKRMILGGMSAVLFLTGNSAAGDNSAPIPVSAPEAKLIKLGNEPSADDREQWERFLNQVIVRNVVEAALYAVLPQEEDRNGRAVLVIPGGGYQFVSMQNEGFPVAERLAKAGYTAFILKYRTKVTRRDPGDFFEDLKSAFTSLGKDRLLDYPPAVEDLITAIDIVKSNCLQLACDGGSVDVIGFSAGARSIIRALEAAGDSLDARSVALIYPPMLDPIAAEPTAPMFLAIAQDDPFFTQGGLVLPDRWLRAGGAIEFHLYHAGGHGFGARATGETSEKWLDAYIAWLTSS